MWFQANLSVVASGFHEVRTGWDGVLELNNRVRDLIKSAANHELLTAIRAVHGGRLFVSMTNDREEATQFLTSPENSLQPLSDREQQVLLFLAEGHTNKEIAERLDLSVKTIETYRARIATKLQLRSRADIVRYALEIGLLRQEGSNSNREGADLKPRLR